MTRSRSVTLFIVALALLLALAAVAPTLAGAAPLNHTRFGSATTSTNWSGYDATGGGFASVAATWTVPTVKPSLTDAYSSFWVGLDGDGSGTVEQLGTDSDSVGGAAVYEVWYEMYPHWPKYVAMTIKPGDTMTASVTAAASGAFTLSITDKTTGQSFTVTEKMKRAKRYSAEVIAEAPWSGGVLPLANFGSVGFTGCTFNAKPIRAFNWNKIDMVENGVTKDVTGPLDNTGTAFTITWKHL